MPRLYRRGFPVQDPSGILYSSTIERHLRHLLGAIHRRWLRSTLVAFQVAVCLVLLIGAGLLARAVHAAQAIDPGFEMKTCGCRYVRLESPGVRCATVSRISTGLAERLARQGMKVAFVDPVPLSGNHDGTMVVLDGQDQLVQVFDVTASANYLEFMGIPILRGRAFNERDLQAHSNVAVLSESTARHFWADESPLGKRFIVGQGRSGFVGSHWYCAGRLLRNSAEGQPSSKLAARRGKRIVLLSPRAIVFIAVEDQIVFLHTQTDRFATDRTITELEELLSSSGFLRVSRWASANLNHARELLPWSSGTWKLKMSNNAELDVSRDRGRQLKSRLG